MGDKPLAASTPKADETIIPNDEASISYVNGLIARGEAVELAPGARLPPGVTYEIIGKTDSGAPILKRRRISMY